MAIRTLEPFNIILTNIYIVMLAQISFNWEKAGCSSHSNVFQIAFLITMVLRVLVHEGYLNRIISNRVYTILMLISSGVFLTGLCVYQIYVLSQKWEHFNYDPKTKEGNLICYQNRIIFIGEIIVGFLCVAKDIGFVILQDEKRPESF